MSKWVRLALLAVLSVVVVLLPGIAARVREQEAGIPEKTGWEGIITCAVVPSFPTVNLNGWLNGVFASFEKQNKGVLVSLKEMTEEGVKAAADEGALPDLLLFGMTLKEETEDYLSPAAEGRTAVPVAKGGYGLLGNVSLLDKIGWSPKLSPQETAELLRENGLSVAVPQLTSVSALSALEHYGDFSGVSVEKAQPHAKVWPGFVLEGEYAFYVATQREIRRMETLCAAGKGIETVLVPVSWTDQVLLCGIVRQELTRKGRDEERQAVCAALAEYLCSEEVQRTIGTAVLFPAAEGVSVYETGTQMAQLEAALS